MTGVLCDGYPVIRLEVAGLARPGWGVVMVRVIH